MFLDWLASSAGFKENYEYWVGVDWKGGSTYKISTKKEKKKEKQLVSLSVTVSNKGNRQVLASLAGYVHIEFFPFFFPFGMVLLCIHSVLDCRLASSSANKYIDRFLMALESKILRRQLLGNDSTIEMNDHSERQRVVKEQKE